MVGSFLVWAILYFPVFSWTIKDKVASYWLVFFVIMTGITLDHWNEMNNKKQVCSHETTIIIEED